MNKKIMIVCGATASGKSHYAIEEAKKNNGIIINADAIQVYRGIPILTAQPSCEDMQIVHHELYGFLDIGTQFSLARWVELAREKILHTISLGKTAILVGGTGLYLQSLIEGFAYIPEITPEVKQYILNLESTHTTEELYRMLKEIDEVAYHKLNINDKKRILRAIAIYHQTQKPISWWQTHHHRRFFNRDDFFIIWVRPPRETIYHNCNHRFLKMLDNGVIDEVKMLLSAHPNVLYPRAIGLPEIIDYINGNVSLDDMIIKVQQYTRNYAKRQNTWFKNQVIPNYISVKTLSL